MTSIIVNGASTDSDLPVDTDLKTFLASQESTVEWIQTDSEFCTISNNMISSARSVASLGNTYNALSGNGTPIADSSAFAGYSVAQLTGTTTQYLDASRPDALTGVFTIIAVARRGSGNIGSSVFGWSDGTSTTAINFAKNGNIQAFHKGTGMAIDSSAGPDAVPRLIMMAFDGTYLYGKVDGGTLVKSDAVTGDLPTSLDSRIFGSGLVGDVSDIAVVNLNLFDDANSDLENDWVTYFSEVYGVDFDF